MNIALWIVQVLTAAGFLYSGWMKALAYPKAARAWPWAGEIGRGFVTMIGLLELLGAAGLILPEALDLKPILTPIAACALAAVVFLGALFHIRRQEYRDIGINIVFLVLALVVAIGRM